MAVTYEYPDKVTTPDLTGIHVDIAASEMTDKNIEYCRWDKAACGEHAAETLEVIWQDTLSGGDKTILDGIVVDNS